MDKNNPKNVSGAQFVQPPESFQVRSATAALDFAVEDLQPGIGCYVGVDDVLGVFGIPQNSSTNVVCNVRLLRPDGEIIALVFVMNLNTPHVVTTQRFQLAEGFILSVVLTTTVGVNDANPIFAWASLQRPPNNLAAQYEVLCSGYISSNYPVSYPAAILAKPTDGPGGLHSQVITVPGAGLDFLFTVPAQTRLRIVTLNAILSTSAAVANRNPSLVVDDGANVVAEINIGINQAASLTQEYTWGDSLPLTALFNNNLLAPLPSQFILPSGFRVRSETTLIDVADQWSAIFMLVQDWASIS